MCEVASGGRNAGLRGGVRCVSKVSMPLRARLASRGFSEKRGDSVAIILKGEQVGCD
jgi:hypothetical protein